ncbi:MAG: RING finger domain-containing protein [Flammeovirgaceae bacterium]
MYAQGDSLITLACFHYFHERCVTKWTESHDTCPVCRLKI